VKIAISREAPPDSMGFHRDDTRRDAVRKSVSEALGGGRDSSSQDSSFNQNHQRRLIEIWIVWAKAHRALSGPTGESGGLTD